MKGIYPRWNRNVTWELRGTIRTICHYSLAGIVESKQFAVSVQYPHRLSMSLTMRLTNNLDQAGWLPVAKGKPINVASAIHCSVLPGQWAVLLSLLIITSLLLPAKVVIHNRHGRSPAVVLLLDFCKAPATPPERGPPKPLLPGSCQAGGVPTHGGGTLGEHCTALMCCDGHQQVAGAPEVLSRSLPLTKGNTTSYYKAAADVTE